MTLGNVLTCIRLITIIAADCEYLTSNPQIASSLVARECATDMFGCDVLSCVRDTYMGDLAAR